MIRRRWLTFCAVIAVLFGGGAVSSAGAQSIRPVLPEVCATVTFVKGNPVTVGTDSSTAPVVKGQALYAGSTLRTDSGARLELTFAGGGIVRLSEDATLELAGDTGEAESTEEAFLVMLLKGQMWANFSSQAPGSCPEVLAACALISGPRSIFRTTLFGLGDVDVKAYTGQVTVSGPFDIEKENGRRELVAMKGAEGENPPEAWRYQIASFRKVIALLSGQASRPFRFSAKSDLTDWVRWNQERDEGEK